TLALIVGIGWGLITLTEVVFVPGEKASEILVLLRILLPYTMFICLVALCMGILNSLGHYAVPAYSPVILNAVWILALFVVCPLFGEEPRIRIRVLSWCILFAGGLQLLAQFPILRAKGIPLRPAGGWGDPRVKRMLLLMGPAALGMGIHQVNAVIDSVLAIIVADWAPAALTYAERLIYLPLGVIATAFGTVLLPAYSKQASQMQHSQMPDTLCFAFSNVLLIMLPASVGLFVLAEPITRLVYLWKGGAFDVDSVTYTARALAFYAPGLAVFSIYKVVVPAFYALQDTRTPVRVGLWAVALNLALNLLFVFTWPEGYKHAGLACATVLASLVNALVLAVLLSKRIGGLRWRKMGLSLARTTVLAALVGMVAQLSYRGLAEYCSQTGLAGKSREILVTGGSILCSIFVFLALALFLSRKEIFSLLRRSTG
ncbi:MAG: murein biosynthesis integral membrane protein MurJ, partial [Verrucomicrobia bacterium]|nr:murein biosynthesis integral membrane protein MurJ [Verrucomicrobiota bacterium]